MLYNENHAIVAWFQRGSTDEEKSSGCDIIEMICQSKTKKSQTKDLSMTKEIIDTNSLAYTKWNCKYHSICAKI